MTKASVMCAWKEWEEGKRGEGLCFRLAGTRHCGSPFCALRCAAYHNLTWRSACSYQLCCAADVTYPVSVSRVPCACSSTCSSTCCCFFCLLVSCRLVLSRVAWHADSVRSHVLGHGLL